MGGIPVKKICLLVAIIIIAFSQSCGYKVLSEDVPLGGSAFHVALVGNSTREPGLEDLLHQALIEELLLDRRVTIVPSDRAETILQTTITGFHLRPTAESDGRATQYEIELNADFRLVNSETSEVLRKIIGLRSPVKEFFSIGPDMIAARAAQEAAEVRACQKLAKELAKKVLLK